MKRSFLILSILLMLMVGCSQEQEVREKEKSISDMAKEMEFTYLKCERAFGYSSEDIAQSPDKLILKYKSLYTEYFDEEVQSCISSEENIDDCSDIPYGVSPYAYALETAGSIPLNFIFLNISKDDIPSEEGKGPYKGWKLNKIVFTLENKRFFTHWGSIYRGPTEIPTKAYTSVETIDGRGWDLDRETLKLTVLNQRAVNVGYSCQISDKTHYEEVNTGLDYIVNEIPKTTYYGEAKKEFTDRYNEKLTNHKASTQKKKREQLEKNKI